MKWPVSVSFVPQRRGRHIQSPTYHQSQTQGAAIQMCRAHQYYLKHQTTYRARLPLLKKRHREIKASSKVSINGLQSDHRSTAAKAAKCRQA